MRDTSGLKKRTRLHPPAAVAALLTFYAVFLRPRLLTWGATTEETTRAYRGDELIPDPHGGATMATTLTAPPEAVWSWLVQMGGDRGGWYSWDFFDNNGNASANCLVPEWQSLQVGQHLYAAPTGASRFVVAVIEANRTLVLRGDYSENIDGIWGFHLRPAAGGSTRLIVRTRNRGRPRAVMRLVTLLWSEPVHFIMQTRQFQNLQARVRTPMAPRVDSARTRCGQTGAKPPPPWARTRGRTLCRPSAQASTKAAGAFRDRP